MSSQSHIVVMGVAGSGKSTVGRALAGALARPFVEADRFHPPANIEAMARGEGLSDRERKPWIAALCAQLRAGPPAVVACSALTPAVRGWLARGAGRSLVWLWLDVPPDVVRRRLEDRTDHFAGPALLQGQLAALSVPRGAIHVDGTGRVADVVERSLRGLP